MARRDKLASCFGLQGTAIVAERCMLGRSTWIEAWRTVGCRMCFGVACREIEASGQTTQGGSSSSCLGTLDGSRVFVLPFVRPNLLESQSRTCHIAISVYIPGVADVSELRAP